jgi:[ribosomal protein S5]-alanine N-acetyltransferase
MGAPLSLETPRLVLRDFVGADWPAVLAWAGHPAVAGPMAVAPFDEPDARAYVARMVSSQLRRPRRRFEVAIVTRDDGRLVGACGMAIASGEGSLGYALAPAAWGRGYATEAATAMLALGFTQVGIRRAVASCLAGNTGSAAVLHKLGFSPRPARWWERWWTPTLRHFTLEASAWLGAALPRLTRAASGPVWPISNASAPTSTTGSTPTPPR